MKVAIVFSAERSPIRGKTAPYVALSSEVDKSVQLHFGVECNLPLGISSAHVKHIDIYPPVDDIQQGSAKANICFYYADDTEKVPFIVDVALDLANTRIEFL